MKRTFLIHLEADTLLPADRLAKELEKLLEMERVVRDARIHVYEVGKDGQ